MTTISLVSTTTMTTNADCYDHPRYWDLAFDDETQYEAEFIRQASEKYSPFPVHRILESGCGGGRQTIELARRGYNVSAFDLNASAVSATQRRLRRTKLSADVFAADMTDFSVPHHFDLAHCFVNSFRHLITEAQALSHLQCMARSLRLGGLYLLGFHLLPPDADEEDSERWTVHSRGLRITTTIRVLEFSRRKRLEVVRFSLRVRSPKVDLKLRTDHTLRIYRADQFRSLLKKVPELQLLDVYDFCYDISEPLKLDDQLGDAVFVLQRV